jgi:ubiquinone biosynthesis protein COQ4
MKKSLQPSEVEYLKGRNAAPQSTSSLLLSSSKYLNSARLREVLVQEALRKSGREVPLTYLVSDAVDAFEELKDRELIDRLLAQEKARKPEFAAWLDARHLSNFSAAELAHFAPGTLGAKVHEFITNSGFVIDFMYLAKPKSDLEYLQKRMAQNHDIEHMVTGFGTNPCGENALMTCNATSWLGYFGAQFAGELCRFNVYLTMVNTLRAGMHYPQVLPVFYEALRYGNEMGSSLRQPLLLMRWEDYFDRTIAEIREELNVVGSHDDGAWAWTDEVWQEPAQ